MVCRGQKVKHHDRTSDHVMKRNYKQVLTPFSGYYLQNYAAHNFPNVHVKTKPIFFFILTAEKIS